MPAALAFFVRGKLNSGQLKISTAPAEMSLTNIPQDVLSDIAKIDIAVYYNLVVTGVFRPTDNKPYKKHFSHTHVFSAYIWPSKCYCPYATKRIIGTDDPKDIPVGAVKHIVSITTLCGRIHNDYGPAVIVTGLKKFPPGRAFSCVREYLTADYHYINGKLSWPNGPAVTYYHYDRDELYLTNYWYKAGQHYKKDFSNKCRNICHDLPYWPAILAGYQDYTGGYQGQTSPSSASSDSLRQGSAGCADM